MRLREFSWLKITRRANVLFYLKGVSVHESWLGDQTLYRLAAQILKRYMEIVDNTNLFTILNIKIEQRTCDVI